MSAPSAVTPMLQQYYQAKREAGDAILFFRLGDFYEMFADDALLASQILDITLTSRDAGKDNRIPMCGVPFHSAEGYIAKLISSGYRVAICEQVQDPKEAKGLVKREIIRTISPGTVIDPTMLEDKSNNYLAAIVCEGDSVGLSLVDVSTGEFLTTQIDRDPSFDTALAELVRIRPSEILVGDGRSDEMRLVERFRQFTAPVVTKYAVEAFSPAAARRTLTTYFNTVSLEAYGCDHLPLAVSAAGAVVRYIKETQRASYTPLTRLQTFNVTGYMMIDASSRRNLELTQTMRDGSRRGSLLWVLDKTKTSMGGRLLKQWLEQPLVDLPAIGERQQSITELVSRQDVREELSSSLSPVGDLERLTARVVFGSANARDLYAIKTSLSVLPGVREFLCSEFPDGALSRLMTMADTLEDVVGEIDRIIVDNPPFSVREGGMIKPGVAEELDELRRAKTEGTDWVASLEQKERERTGIKSLKVSFNQVFGYYIEITKANYDLVPDDYIRKQTLANAERYITPELKEYEELILGADEKISGIEYRLFQELRQYVSENSHRIQQSAAVLARLDVFLSLAEAASDYGYVRPYMTQDNIIKISDGRHPVVERMLTDDKFVANDCVLNDEESFAIITGPNMAGKSTYIRQVALITLMAQIGSFVPAREAEIGIVDRIFTRVGASDDLTTGRSTFMVELSELANILNHATSKSLVVLDEIGRGTSTFDGLSIAWACIEYIHDSGKIGAKTLFATHYHELTELEKVLPGVRNYSVAIKEMDDDIIFLRKIVRGGAGRSFGVEVAKLAGLPHEVVERAREILHNLEQTDDLERKHQKSGSKNRQNVRHQNAARVMEAGQLPLFAYGKPVADELTRQIAGLDLDSITPIQALLKLNELRERAKQLVKDEQDQVAIGGVVSG